MEFFRIKKDIPFMKHALIFNAIETALNIIFRSRRYRNYLTSKLLALAMIPLGWARSM